MVYLLLFNASYYLRNPITTSGACYKRSACVEYQSAIQTSCGSGFLWHGLDFSRAWCTMRLISGEKTGSMCPCRRWSLWTLAVTLLAWHSSCHTSQPVLFRATNASPQLALFRATNIWRNTTNFQSNESVTFHKLVWRHFQVGWASGLQFVLFWDNANN